ncbi:MAG: putative Transcription initiation factor TFIID subunit 6, partial [Streblomastix strix]
KALSDHAELELRKIIEDAARFMRISKRTVLKPSDINFALQSRGEQPVFGYEFSTPHALQRVPGVPGIYKEDDEEIDLSTLINEPFPPIPHPPSFTAHWLAIDGVQPLIPQNPIPSKLLEAIQRDPSSILSDPSLAHELGIDTAQVGQGQSHVYGNGIEIKPPIKHDLSQELQLFYEKATQFILDVKDSLFENRIEGEPQQQQNFTSSQAVSNITDAQHRLESVYQSISGDPGLQQLMPYFSQFVATEIIRNIHNCAVLYSIMRFVSAIFSSPYLNVDPYCHILIPAVLTCTLSNELGTLEDREYAKGGVLAQNDLGSIIVSTSGKVESSSSKRITQSSSGISSKTSTSNASYPQQPKQRQVAPQPQITNSTPERAFRVTHFDVRRFSALLLSKICRRLAISFSTFEMRLANTLVLSLLDPTRTLASHYGATVSLVA